MYAGFTDQKYDAASQAHQASSAARTAFPGDGMRSPRPDSAASAMMRANSDDNPNVSERSVVAALVGWSAR